MTRVTEVKAPNPYNGENKIKIFLAGAIDMGAAIDWQKQVVEYFKDWNRRKEILFLNPRRDDWDSSWKQVPEDKQFSEQVNWEISGLENSDLVFLCLPKDSKAPISLLELGLMAGGKKKIIVMCDKEFYRYGNVAITCNRYNCKLHTDISSALTALKTECIMMSIV
jgi:hypothetical protein